MKFLVWGHSGWIGNILCDLLRKENHVAIPAHSRLENYSNICEELKDVNPDFVLNAAGIAGRPTIDWCESHKEETYFVNVIGTSNLIQACHQAGLHLTNYSSGCIYTYDLNHPIGYKFSENDIPNFEGSTYSRSKILTEKITTVYNNVLTLRIRLPMSNDYHLRSLLSKLIKYSKVIDIPNSITILPELLPISFKMAQNKLTGVYNFTNPGAVTHSYILNLYKKYIDPNFTWGTFTIEDQNKILQAPRSNCQLDTTKLQTFCKVTPVEEALEYLFQQLATINK